MKIASFTYKAQHYVVSSSDWFWQRVRRYKFTIIGVLLVVLGMLLAGTSPAQAEGLDGRYLDSRYCGEPLRTPTGAIARDYRVTGAFRRLHACPSTGLHVGACPRWAMDHVIPLDVGGCDSVSNVQWLPDWLKSCAGHCKDRWERKVNCRPIVDGGTGCNNELIGTP